MHPEEPLDPEELHDEDFQFVLKALLAAYTPLLEEDLKRAQDPEALKKEAEARPPDCEEELALGGRLFDAFFSEEIALRSLPPEGRELLGPPERWRWCLLHIRCCLIFGWLVCRRPRSFRAFAYYLYRYWRCIREVLGRPVSTPPTSEERQDFELLVKALAGAYKPYLSDQLASVEFPAGLPDEVLTGRIDCFEGDEAAIFERLHTLEVARALLGREAFEEHAKAPFFWFCRCWCLCAIRFGCCLASAKNFVDVLRCLAWYRRCLRECFRPLHCDLDAPSGCTEEAFEPKVGGLAVAVIGTAAGAFFDRYTLQWRKVEGAGCDDEAGWSSDGVVYPGGGTSGASAVVGGLLGWINTTVLPGGSYEVRVCVFASQPQGARRCCCIVFNLFKRLVWIERIANAPVQTPPGPFVSTAPIVSANPGGSLVPVGCCVTVKGSAFVGDCNDRRIKCFDLRYGLNFLPGPGEAGFNPGDYFGSLLVPTGPVCYVPPEEAGKRAPWNQVIGRALTTRLVKTTIELFGSTIEVWKLQDFCFDSASLLPPCPDAQHTCRSGKYTLLLDVEDTLGNHYYDTQHVWFDNKPIHVEFGGLEGVAGCDDVSLKKMVPPGAPCGIPWPLNLLGIAYDEFIDNADLGYPSDNFDFYTLSITRQGGPTYTVPITPVLPPLGGTAPLVGITRVGDPGTRCEESFLGCPPPPHPPKFHGVLSRLDLRIFDAVCAQALDDPPFVAPFVFAPPAGFALERGECCGYTFQLYAQDKTWSDGGGAGQCHRAWSLPWAVCICNDLGERDRGERRDRDQRSDRWPLP